MVILTEQAESVAAGPKLRDLTDEEFQQRYNCDRFTATILANRFRYLVSHMANQLRTHAFSPIIRDAADLCGMLSGPPGLGFPMASVSETLPLFYGSIPDAVRVTLEEYGVQHLVPGDTVLVNDYYRVGTHFNDACSIRPIFYEGALVGAVTLRAHLQDIGGASMSYSLAARRNTWQDGLRLPPILLYSAGEPVVSTFKLLYDNTRLGYLIVPDLRTVFHALELGERLLLESIDKYGLDAYFGTMRYVGDASAETMSTALAGLPDGVYEGEEWIDGDGLADSPEHRVRVRITKVGDRAEFDLRGSSPATRTSMNCAWPDIKTGVTMALKLLIDPKSPVTSGTLRNVDVVVPPGAIFNPYPPHACFGYYEVVMLIVHAIYQALNPVLGPDAVTASNTVKSHTAQAYGPDGEEIFGGGGNLEGGLGPWGATKHGDGDSTQQSVFLNLLMMGGTETFEVAGLKAGLPAVSLGSEYVPDTGGAGANRGGAASGYDTLYLYDAEHQSSDFHAKRPVAGGGVFGGQSGPTGASWLWDSEDTGGGVDVDFLPEAVDDPVYEKAIPQIGLLDPATNQFDPEGEFVYVFERRRMAAGAISRQLTQGGGGWGDPLDRDPQRVKIDVRDQYVTIEGAARDYGVIILGDPDRDPEGLQIDEAATQELREKGRKQRPRE
jgi:N-methylhydantoinase B